MRLKGLKIIVDEKAKQYCCENTTDRIIGYCFLGWRLLYPGAKTEFIPFGSKPHDFHFADGKDLKYAYAMDIAENFMQEMNRCD